MQSQTSDSVPCKFCEHTGPHRVHSAQERKYGIGGTFHYMECAGCGTLQLLDVPTNLGDFYPDNYYSFNLDASASAAAPSALRRQVRTSRTRHALGRFAPFGSLLSKFAPDYFAYPWDWFRLSEVGPESKILDVGCGGGALLRAMRSNGFANLYGVDPFLKATVIESGLQLTKGEIFDLNENFDLVMFHHALEHVRDPRRHLRAAYGLCRPGGRLLVRIPIVDSFGWRHYRDRWFALDAPRHLVIPTRAALIKAAEQVGFEFVAMNCDSEACTGWGSEAYKRDLPEYTPDGRHVLKSIAPFTSEELAGFEQQAKELNAANDGDMGCFYFRRPAAQ